MTRSAASLGAAIALFVSLSAGAADLAPHSAVYALSLARADTNSGVESAEGTMKFEVADACAGWTVEQRFKLHIGYADTDDTDFNITFVTWEAKDGKKYRFNVRKEHVDEPDDILVGTAEAGGRPDRNKARFAKPLDQVIDLPAETLFPTGHTLALIGAASNGRHFLSKPVFDGGTVEPSYLVTASIGDPNAGVASDPNTLLRARWWPISMAFFAGDGTDVLPEYELSMQLQENGIARDIHIDYGRFAIHAVLKSLEPMSKPDC